jgi:hypothetical protein
MATKPGFEGTYWITEAERLLLHRLVESVPGDYLEIGSFDGIVAVDIARTFPDRAVHCVDLFQPGHATNGGHLETFAANVAAHRAANVRIFEGDSRQVVPTLAPGYGVVFVDGDHAYDTVLADLRNAWAKLSPQGMLAFHDYGHVDDVTRAVDDFLAEKLLAIALRVDSIGCVAGPWFDTGRLQRLRRWIGVRSWFRLVPLRQVVKKLVGRG